MEEYRRKRQQDSLTRILGWSTLGIILPGINFIMGGLRKLGVTVLIVYLGLISGLIYYGLNTDLKSLTFRISSSSDILLMIIGGSLLIGILWVVQYLLGFFSLHKHHLSQQKKVISRIIAAILSIIIMVPFGLVSYYAYETRSTLIQVFSGNQTQTEKKNAPSIQHQDPWAHTNRVNILALGSDETAHREGVRPDVIMVASIDTNTGRTELFNIPRNLRHAPFPEDSPGNTAFPQGFTDGEGLINEVWTWAETQPELFSDSPSPGLTATEDAVEGSLGLEIDYTLRINMKGFEDLVDALGGVTVDVPRDLPKAKEGVVPDDYVYAGENQTLDGNDALWYIRSRAGSSDYDRMERTRCMVKAMTNEISPQSLITRYPSLLGVLKKNFHTDMEQKDIEAWAELLDKVQDGGIHGVALTDEVITPFNPDYEAIHAIVDESINESKETSAPTHDSDLPYVVDTPAVETTPTEETVPTQEPEDEPNEDKYC